MENMGVCIVREKKSLEIDSIVVREAVTVFELLIQKIMCSKKVNFSESLRQTVR